MRCFESFLQNDSFCKGEITSVLFPIWKKNKEEAIRGLLFLKPILLYCQKVNGWANGWRNSFDVTTRELEKAQKSISQWEQHEQKQIETLKALNYWNENLQEQLKKTQREMVNIEIELQDAQVQLANTQLQLEDSQTQLQLIQNSRVMRLAHFIGSYFKRER